MNSVNNFLFFSQTVPLILVVTLLGEFLAQVKCLNFSYTNISKEKEQDFTLTEHSNIAYDNIQVTFDFTNASGRIWYKHPFKLWSKKKNVTASFNSTFIITIVPKTDPWGEGLAFILTKDSGYNYIPDNSYGQWLGIVNASTNGSSENDICAVEFDTRKSYLEDIDDNHVGVDINSVYSTKQVWLNGHGVNLSSRADVTASVQYDGESKTLAIYAFMSDTTGDNVDNLILNMPLDLSDHLPEDVFVGFSASTGEYSEINCIRLWNFTSTDIDDADADADADADDFLWLWILLSMISVFLFSGYFIYLYRTRKNKEKKVVGEDRKVELQIFSLTNAPQKFRLNEVKSATGNFDPKNKLGKGGCGVVYKGVLNNTEVAVKRFSKDSKQGKQEFIAEITIIGSLHHKNLAKLVGWCYESNELIVVYEFMPNGSLDKVIFCNENEESSRSSVLSWETRCGVIFGVAQALDYLHNGCEKRVLHRDIKASNIMLDSDYNAKLGDFGLARTIQVIGKTHHSTKEIAGTPGYMAPECFLTGRATVETDVYAFGVVILEVACGRKPLNKNEQNIYSNSIIDWVWERYGMKTIVEAIDTRLEGDFEKEQVECVLKLGLACCHPNPYQRPSIRVALQVLTGEAPPPPLPFEKPAFTWPAMSPTFNESSDYSRTPITLVTGR